jgi:peptide/nickel transport system permease protein
VTVLTAITGSLAVLRPRRVGVRVWLPLVPAAVFVLLAVIGPLIVPFSATTVVGPSTTAPNAAHWFGTDSAGMDVFSRSIAAIQVDLAIAASVTVLATAAGVLLGVLVGMGEGSGGLVGLLARGIARILDLADAVPVIVVAMVVVAFFGATPTTLVIALSIVLAPSPARLTRTEVLRIRSEAYLDAARLGGMSEARLSFRHVLPNAAVPAVENTSVIFGIAIAVAAALGFLGVGVTPPTPEWGSMIARGTSDMISGRWWSALFPAVVLALAIASFAVAGGRLVQRLKQ